MKRTKVVILKSTIGASSMNDKTQKKSTISPSLRRYKQTHCHRIKVNVVETVELSDSDSDNDIDTDSDNASVCDEEVEKKPKLEPQTEPEISEGEPLSVTDPRAKLIEIMLEKHRNLNGKPSYDDDQETGIRQLTEKMTPEDWIEFGKMNEKIEKKGRKRSDLGIMNDVMQKRWRKERLKQKKEEEMASMTPEEMEEYHAMLEEKKKEQRLKYNERRRKKLQEMTPDARAEFYRKKNERRNISEEVRNRNRFQEFCRQQTKFSQMTEEERREWTRKNTEKARKWRESLTGERLEKYQEYERERHRGKGTSAVQNYKRLITTMTPEERRKRLRRYQVNAAAQKLRKQLREEGIPPEEIKKQADNLKKRMWEEPLPPLEVVSSYKPRPRKNDKKKDLDAASESQAIAVPTPNIPKGKGRPPSSYGTYQRRKILPPLPKVISNDATAAPPSPQFDDIFDLEDDSSIDFHEDSNCAPATPANINSEQERDEAEVPSPPPIIQFDLKCPHCASNYSDKSDLLAHISSEHPNNCWKCPVCQSIVLSPSELREHFQSDHPNETGIPKRDDEKKFKCIKCTGPDSIAFESQNGLLEHFKSNHPEFYWPCPKCNILKYTERSLNLHSKLCKGSSGSEPKKSVNPNPDHKNGICFDCTKCKSVFKSLLELKIHVKYTHPDEYWPCPNCNDFKYSANSFQYHKSRCPGNKISKKSVRRKK